MAKANVDVGVLDGNDDELPEVIEDGMSGTEFSRLGRAPRTILLICRIPT
jgi:hypothetical protein